MKTQYFILISILFFVGCESKENLADAYGNFETVEVNISPVIPGKIIYLNLEEGNTVSKNQLLAIVDTTSLFINKNGLKAKKEAILSKLPTITSQVNVIDAQIKVLEKEKTRVEKLIEGNAATTKQLDDINGQIQVMNQQKNATLSQRASISKEAEAINFQVESLSDKIEQSKIYAPLNGTVLLKAVEFGEVINPGKVLAKIAKTDVLNLRVYFSGDQLNKFKIGDDVSIEFDKTKTENSKTKGKIIWVADKAEFTPKIIQTKKERVNLVYAAKIEVPNNGELKIGMPGEVFFSAND